MTAIPSKTFIQVDGVRNCLLFNPDGVDVPKYLKDTSVYDNNKEALHTLVQQLGHMLHNRYNPFV